jgi:putative membrane-bound dehydrogenase-like protein
MAMRRGLLLLLFSAALAAAVPGAGPEIPVPPVPPEQAAARMRMPQGFRATLVAGEPTLIKPIGMTTDDRGRLWVVESHTYPFWQAKPVEGHDRILIFEEHDGVFGPPTVFLNSGVNLSGIATGFGGIWLTAPPNLLFIPMQPGTDKPAGPAQVVLDGWDVTARHNVVNDLMWGPDGWLYGLNGILSNSKVGAPGTPADQRTFLNCGVWRYHPTRKLFEVVASGTTNPWGIDFDDYGEIFITNCVIKHLFHIVPGGRYTRMFGEDAHPNSFGLMPSCADHIHWGGGDWTTSRGGGGSHDAPGGGHAHAGAILYLGDNWPDEYRNNVLMCNIHGNRLNRDILERTGSGYVAHHGRDFLFADDTWFRGLALQAAADGGVFIDDWHDTGECHNYEQVQPCGRIFKVTYGQPKQPADLSTKSDAELVQLQLHKNEWLVRHARRLLQERTGAGKLTEGVRPALRKMLAEQTEETRELRALWALNVVGGIDEAGLLSLLDAKEPAIRVWAVRLLAEDGKPSDAAIARFALAAKNDPAPSVRLALASALRRLPLEKRWALAEALAAHGEDSADANLPLMIWFGIEPLMVANPERSADLLLKTRIPTIRQDMARRLAGTAH